MIKKGSIPFLPPGLNAPMFESENSKRAICDYDEWLKSKDRFSSENSIRLAYKAVESATIFCKMRGNPYVELVHWLNQSFNWLTRICTGSSSICV